MLAVVMVKPIRLSVSATPGDSNPKEAKRRVRLLNGIFVRLITKAVQREPMLAVS
jgi:hypothetical protein